MIGWGLGRHIISSPRAVRAVRGEGCFELGESLWAYQGCYERGVSLVGDWGGIPPVLPGLSGLLGARGVLI